MVRYLGDLRKIVCNNNNNNNNNNGPSGGQRGVEKSVSYLEALSFRDRS